MNTTTGGAKNVLIGGLFHETHTFLESVTPLSDCQVLHGLEMLAVTGDPSPLGGFLEVAESWGWHLIPSIDVRATPSATMADEVVELWWSHFYEALESALQRGLDGIFLVLHGAMVSQSCLDVEGEMLERIRTLVGPDIPIGGVTDLHANVSPRMASNSNALVTYRENPHTDAREAAVRAARLLARLMHGEKATTVFEQPPIMWPPTGTGTANEPMCELEAMARHIEATHPEIWAVNVHAGYSYADTPSTGVSFSAITIGAEDVAARELKALSQRAIELKEVGNVVEPALQAVLPRVLELLKTGIGGPIVLAEPSDNIGGGAPGDSTHILRALLGERVDNAAVIINDPQAVARLQTVEIGTRLQLPVGGASGPLSGGPLHLDVELLSRSDGKFELEDAHSHLASSAGRSIQMGPCAVVRCQGVRILLTSLKAPPFDLGQLRSQGIVPETLSLVAVKSAVAYRQAYDPIAHAHFAVATPGPCASDLRVLPFQHIRRPIYPLDTFVS